MRLVSNFNPRSREGSDRMVGPVCLVAPISIHAPVKGATCAALAWAACLAFQSTLP